MDYQEALDYIHSFINYEKIGMPPATSTNFNLERMAYFLAQLGDPQLKYPSVVIAGTKGKGSTAAFCASALQAAGHRVALYTQPHLHTYRERMRVNGELISQEELATLVSRLRPAVDQTLAEATRFGRLTFYELGTGLALFYFAEKQVDVAVLEIGLGGRLDAVNVVTPLVSVITSISYDHMDVLGHTLTEIAGEKAGIIKPGVPVVSPPQQAEALAVLENVCREKSAPFHLVEAASWIPPTNGLDEQHRHREFQKFRLPGFSQDFETALLGDHQLLNVAVAAKTLQLLGQSQPQLAVNPAQLTQGFRQVKWAGRLEVLEDKPGTPLLVVDGAHNADSARRLGHALNRLNFYYQKVVFIVGTSGDKDIEGIFQELRHAYLLPAAFILTRSHNPRALNPAEIQRRGFSPTTYFENGPSVILTETVTEALETARRIAQPLDLICATGSLFVTAEVREAAGLELEKD